MSNKTNPTGRTCMNYEGSDFAFANGDHLRRFVLSAAMNIITLINHTTTDDDQIPKQELLEFNYRFISIYADICIEENRLIVFGFERDKPNTTFQAQIICDALMKMAAYASSVWLKSGFVDENDVKAMVQKADDFSKLYLSLTDPSYGVKIPKDISKGDIKEMLNKAYIAGYYASPGINKFTPRITQNIQMPHDSMMELINTLFGDRKENKTE